ncbi:MAG TPA: YheU family protein [Desulfuromonadaceae bacterium]
MNNDEETGPFVTTTQEQLEEGVDIPWERINPDTLQNMVAEFVSREWADLGDCNFTMEDKIAQVMQQLKAKKVKVVFDLTTETGNIVVCR